MIGGNRIVAARGRRNSRPPLLLDLFCGAGGAALGYMRAGFHVVGVDIRPQPRYPFIHYRADALDVLRVLADGLDYNEDIVLRDISVIHASPPCQRYTALRTREDLSSYPDLIAPVRELLDVIGLPFVIENVEGAPLRPSTILCGASFGLRVYRHRWFEVSYGIQIEPMLHEVHQTRVNRRGENRKEHWANGGFLTVTGDIGKYVGPEGMGIDWMTGDELREAIPPAYTEYIGHQMNSQVGRRRALV